MNLIIDLAPLYHHYILYIITYLSPFRLIYPVSQGKGQVLFTLCFKDLTQCQLYDGLSDNSQLIEPCGLTCNHWPFIIREIIIITSMPGMFLGVSVELLSVLSNCPKVALLIRTTIPLLKVRRLRHVK